jgi:hypothetical protein
MISNLKSITKIASVLVFGSVFLYNCEPEADNLGEQFFSGAELSMDSINVVAYNINNNDSIRSDASELSLAPLGAFSEGVFGMQKAAYVSQVRMSAYDPDFGANAVVDSAVLVLKPLYASDSSTVTTDENYIYSEGNIPAKKVVTSYPVLKYGKADAPLHIRVHEVTDFLGSASDMYFSNKAVNYNTELGSKAFNGRISSSAITKDADNSNLWSNDASLRVPLSAAFFQNKIIAQEGSSDLKDAANFIRYFRGIRVSVDENDGYIFKFTPSNAEIIMYYKYDKVENGTTTRPQTSYKFSLGDPNVHIGQFTYNRTDTPTAVALANANAVTGDPKLYIQGMGGPSFGIRIPDAEITKLKEKFKNDKIGIIGAKIRVYTDEVVWNNAYEKPSTFIFLQKDATGFLPEMTTLNTVANFNLVSAFDLKKNPAYYDLTVTKSLKDIIETEAANKDFVVHVGSFKVNEKDQLLSHQYDNRAYMANRLVLVGTDAANSKRIQLKVVYGTK